MVKIGAHRGGCGIAPENTLAAINTAIQIGADHVEFDVRATSDGELVLMHDRSTKRTTGVDYLVDKIPYDLLSKLKTEQGEPPPRLRDALECLAQSPKKNVKGIIELKRFSKQAIETLARTIHDMVAQTELSYEQIRILSGKEELRFIPRLKELLPEVELAVVSRAPSVREGVIQPPYIQKAMDEGCSVIHAHYAKLTNRFINHAHAHGITVCAGGAHTERALRYVLNNIPAVDEVNTNYVLESLAILHEPYPKDDGLFVSYLQNIHFHYKDFRSNYKEFCGNRFEELLERFPRLTGNIRHRMALRNQSSFRFPDVVAHRGDSRDYPENTLTAILSALKAGAPIVEFDVRRTKDGVLILMHDKTLNRTTNGSGRVEDTLYKDIKALDAGDGNPPPTLEETLKLIATHNASLSPDQTPSKALIDWKTGNFKEMASAILNPEHGLGIENISVINFRRRPLRELKCMIPELKIGWLTIRSISSKGLQQLRSEGFSYVCPYKIPATRWLVDAAHHAGLEVYSWTINSGYAAKKAIQNGVDFIGTDMPGNALHYLDHKRHNIPVETEAHAEKPPGKFSQMVNRIRISHSAHR